MLIPSFQVIFGKKVEGFFRKKGKEFLFTMLFALLQAVIFFVTVIMFVTATKVVWNDLGQTSPDGRDFLRLSVHGDRRGMHLCHVLSIVLCADAAEEAVDADALDHPSRHAPLGGGKNLFKFYALRLVKLTAVFGAYGMFIAFLFWLYYSVFVFIVCAELQSVLLQRANREPQPSSAPSLPSP